MFNIDKFAICCRYWRDPLAVLIGIRYARSLDNGTVNTQEANTAQVSHVFNTVTLLTGNAFRTKEVAPLLVL